MATKPIEPLITDRTINDVRNKTTRGNYNKEDFNRIQHWQIYLRDLLNEYGYYCNISPHEDWVTIDPRQSDVDKLKSDTKALKDTYYSLHEYDLHIGRTNIDYITANNIEKILKDIEYLVESMQSYYVHSGVATANQSRLWSNRFRRY